MQVHLTEENLNFSFETEEAKEWFEKSDWRSWVFFVQCANIVYYSLHIIGFHLDKGNENYA